MAKTFSAGPQSKYSIEELDKAAQYYTGNPNAKYSDLTGPENKPLRVKIRKALEYRGGKFVIPGSLPQDSDKVRTSQKLQEFLKGKTTIKQSELIKKLDDLGYKNPKVQVNNIAFDNPQLTVIRDVPKAPQPPRESKIYSKSELNKATRGEHKKNPDRITKPNFDDLNRTEKAKIFTRLFQNKGKYSPNKKINNPLSKEIQKDIKNKFANLYDDWDFKNNKFGVSNLKDNANVYNKVVNFVKEGKPYELAADLKSADGWMGAQMDRAVRLGDTRYKPIRKMINNQSKIIGFIDNTDFGKGNKYLFAEKFITGSNADGVLMSSHPDFKETKKFRDIANQAKLPVGGALKNILKEKGINTSKISLSDLYKYMMGEVGIEGTKNAIEQHHIKGVGVRATGDYQILDRDLNALAREATKEIESGNLKRVKELEDLGIRVDVGSEAYGTGSGKASSDFLKIKDKVTNFYKNEPEGARILNVLKTAYADAGKGSVIQKGMDAEFKCADGCFIKVANSNPQRIINKVKKEPQKLIRLFRGEEPARKTELYKATKGSPSMYEESLKGRFFFDNPADARYYAQRQGSLTGNVKSVDVPENMVNIGRKMANRRRGPNYGSEVILPKKFVGQEKINIPQTAMARAGAIVDRIKNQTPPIVPNTKYNADAGTFVNTKTNAPDTNFNAKAYAENNPVEVKAGTEDALKPIKGNLLKTVGKSLAYVGAPLPTALIDSYFVGKQISEDKSAVDIAKDPLNWLGLATMSSLSNISGVTKPGKLNAALRLGMSPGLIRGVSRFAGIPGLAISTALTAYDQYEKYKNEEGLIYNLFNDKAKAV